MSMHVGGCESCVCVVWCGCVAVWCDGGWRAGWHVAWWCCCVAVWSECAPWRNHACECWCGWVVGSLVVCNGARLCACVLLDRRLVWQTVHVVCDVSIVYVCVVCVMCMVCVCGLCVIDCVDCWLVDDLCWTGCVVVCMCIVMSVVGWVGGVCVHVCYVVYV